MIISHFAMVDHTDLMYEKTYGSYCNITNLNFQLLTSRDSQGL